MRIDSGELKGRLLNNPEALAAIEELEAQAKRMGEQETLELSLTFGYSQANVIGRITIMNPEVIALLNADGRYELARTATRKPGGENQLIGVSLVPMMKYAMLEVGEDDPVQPKVNTTPPVCKTPMADGHADCVFFCLHEIDRVLRERAADRAEAPPTAPTSMPEVRDHKSKYEGGDTPTPVEEFVTTRTEWAEGFRTPTDEPPCGCTGAGA